MNERSLWEEIKKIYNGGWEEIDYCPKWVSKAFLKCFNKNYYRGNGNPYDKTYIFKGNRFIYKIRVDGDVQGGSYYYYRKKKEPKFK